MFRKKKLCQVQIYHATADYLSVQAREPWWAGECARAHTDTWIIMFSCFHICRGYVRRICPEWTEWVARTRPMDRHTNNQITPSFDGFLLAVCFFVVVLVWMTFRYKLIRIMNITKNMVHHEYLRVSFFRRKQSTVICIVAYWFPTVVMRIQCTLQSEQ